MTPDKELYIAGKYKVNFHKKEFEYKSFLPTNVNQPYMWTDRRIPVLLESAVKLIGELNAYSLLIPDVDFFIGMHVKNEALKSSRIEGTRTELDEAILPEKEILPEKREDWQEVQNYIEAMNFSVEKLKELPLCLRLLKDSHAILLKNVRGKEKEPGEIRRSQNWIGGTNLQMASFIPPHPDELPDLLGDIELFWNNQSLEIPKLIKIAISHYQFETIHPFLDGNGRIGRLLITLQLIEYDILTKPIFYISDFLERYKGEYYDGLTFVRTRNDLDQWIIFFLSAAIETAKKGKQTFERIIDLRQKYEKKILELGVRAKIAHQLLIKLFSSPVIDVSGASELLGISISTSNTLINELEKIGILKESTGFSRNRIFILDEYISLFKN